VNKIPSLLIAGPGFLFSAMKLGKVAIGLAGKKKAA
jgi:hypothetical protein